MYVCGIKIIVFLELKPRLNIKINLTGQAKINILQRFLGIHWFAA
jgi:hypothetical protein